MSVVITIAQGSGSTYVYGYCDATYRDNWGRDETVEFVKNSTPFLSKTLANINVLVALALAMSRDGSSGGVIRMCVITEEGVERLFVPGDQLPKFWEGRDVPGTTKLVKGDNVVPMAVEA
jgi:20S proteasome subunit beta 1